jgi:hypothetical protein
MLEDEEERSLFASALGRPRHQRMPNHLRGTIHRGLSEDGCERSTRAHVVPA